MTILGKKEVVLKKLFVCCVSLAMEREREREREREKRKRDNCCFWIKRHLGNSYIYTCCYHSKKGMAAIPLLHCCVKVKSNKF